LKWAAVLAAWRFENLAAASYVIEQRALIGPRQGGVLPVPLLLCFIG
jgi:hypothetical protein